MEAHLFAIIVLAYLVYISGKVSKKTLKNRADLKMRGVKVGDVEMLHNSAHLSHSLLMTILGTFLLLSLVFLFFEMWIYEAELDNHETSFVFAMFCSFLISNVWYMGHVLEEEYGKFDH